MLYLYAGFLVLALLESWWSLRLRARLRSAWLAAVPYVVGASLVVALVTTARGMQAAFETAARADAASKSFVLAHGIARAFVAAEIEAGFLGLVLVVMADLQIVGIKRMPRA